MGFGGSFPFLQFVWVPPELERKMRTTFLSGGLVSIAGSVLTIIVLIVAGGEIPIAAIFEGASAFGVLMSGIYMMTGRSCVSSGYVNLTIAGQARRPIFGMWVFSIIVSVLGYLILTMYSTTPGANLGVVILGILMPIPMLVLAGVNHFIVGRRMLPPTEELLRSYGATRQVVGPQWGAPPQAGPSHPGPPQG